MSDNVPSIAILSSFPPTQCGLATFTMALGTALTRRDIDVGVVRVLDQPEFLTSRGLATIAEMVAGMPSSIDVSMKAMNDKSVALIQHEYGLYGGPDGDEVLELLDGLDVPIISILHTVLPRPTEHQRDVLNRVMRASTGVVVMTEVALGTLHRVFDVGDTPVRVIPHGAAVSITTPPASRHGRPVILTWGLIGPGKGIEWAIDAMAALKDLRPRPLYVIAGRTHPKVLAHAGDTYRQSLEQRVIDNGVEDYVVFDNSYRDLDSLNQLIAGSTAVVLPYDSPDQATSGVLVDAVAAGRPVIATEFPHAVELLGGERAGITVAHRDPDAISDAIRRVLTDPELAFSLASAARRFAPQLSWDAVADKYAQFSAELLERVSVGAR